MRRVSLRHDQVTADEMAALLAELNDVGGTVTDTARPYTSNEKHGGVVNAGTNEGGFSTYDEGLTDVLREDHNIAPLNVRLAPLGVGGKKAAAPPVVAGGKRPPPPLKGGTVEKPPEGVPTGPQRQFSFRNKYGDFIKQEEAEAEAAAAAKAKAEAEAHAASVEQGAVTDNDPATVGPYREANFLPVMCARYLRPAGIAPPGRWGHTLTGVTATRLFMFGGMEVSGAESAAFMELDSASIAWDPVFVAKGQPPCARYGHAACSFESRYFVVCGGATKGGAALLGDIHVYDIHTQEWSCLWAGGHGVGGRLEPAPRMGHTVIVREDRLYIYGGRVAKSGAGDSLSNLPAAAAGGGEEQSSSQRERDGVLTTTLASPDVYVFSLNTKRWRRRLRAPRKDDAGGGSGSSVPRRRSSATTTAAAEKQASGKPQPPPKGSNSTSAATVPSPGDAKGKKEESDEKKKGKEEEGEGEGAVPLAPAARVHHAACVKGDIMYINGGSGSKGEPLTDTWALSLVTGEWRCLHYGGTADAVPREKHGLFVCGEALLLVGGCGTSVFSDRVTGKFNNFAAVLPLVPQANPCWIPVAMGNTSILAPSRKSFGAAFVGGFVYVFGGVSGSEAATNTLVRFLAADGYVTVDDRARSTSGEQSLRAMMQRARERSAVPFDMYAVVDAAAAGDGKGTFELAEGAVGFHRALLQQRAPLLWEALQECRTEPLLSARMPRGTAAAAGGGGGGGASKPAPVKDKGEEGGIEEAGAAEDEVDAFMKNVTGAGAGDAAGAASGGGGGGTVATLYYTMGNSRVKGLPASVSSEELRCLAEYAYYGGLRGEFKLLLEDAEDKKATAAGDDSGAPVKSSTVEKQREALSHTLTVLKELAGLFKLPPLQQLCEALLAGSRKQLAAARAASVEALRADLLAMQESGTGATMTVLFVDPHTRNQTTLSLHPVVLAAASNFFADLLRPLYTGERSSFQLGSVAAKTTVGVPLCSSTARRAVLVGPVPVPTPAIAPIVRFLYSQHLHAPREVAFETMLGARQLGLTPLQSFCEAIVAREEVTYTSCCSFYYMARKHAAPLLEEMSLITAVSGYGEVSRTDGFLSLSEEDKKSIRTVAEEMGSVSWVPPPQPGTELKSKDVYKGRFEKAGGK